MANAKRKLTPEQQREKMLSILTPVVSVLLALIVGAIIIACLGKNPVQGYGAMLQGSLGDINKIGKTLERACPLIFTSLAAVFAYKCGVFNLGGEGQFIMGASAAAYIVITLGLTGVPAMLVALVAGIVFGGLWALLPGLLKITRGLNEMITTIMFNYIALYFMEFLYKNVYSDQGLPQTPAMPKSAHLMDIGPAHLGVLLAIILGLLVWYVIFRTSFGFKIRAVGMSPTASRVNGFPVRMLTLLAFVISGAIAGMGGMIELFGKTPFRLADGLMELWYALVDLLPFEWAQPGSMYFMKNALLAVLVISPLFGILSTGGTMMQSVIGVPTAIVDIIRGMIIIFAVAGMAMVKLPKVKALLSGLGSKNKKAEVTA